MQLDMNCPVVKETIEVMRRLETKGVQLEGGNYNRVYHEISELVKANYELKAMIPKKAGVPVLVPDRQFQRISDDGTPYKIMFGKESIEKIFNEFRSMPKTHELYINEETHPLFDDSFPVGSLMAVVNPEDIHKPLSIEIKQ